MLTAMQYQLGVKMWLSRNPVALTTLQQLSTYIKTFLERSQDISNKNCHLKGKKLWMYVYKNLTGKRGHGECEWQRGYEQRRIESQNR